MRLKPCPKPSPSSKLKSMSCSQSLPILNSMRATPPYSRKSLLTLGELQLKITAAEEQWLELEILREELANN